MNKLETQHIDFLRTCAAQPNKIHSSTLPVNELMQMTQEGLLISYNKPSGVMYCITKAGASVARTYGASKDLIDLAIKQVVLQGFPEDEAKKIVEDNGAEAILKSIADVTKQGSEGQREVIVPTNELGKPEIKFRG